MTGFSVCGRSTALTNTGWSIPLGRASAPALNRNCDRERLPLATLKYSTVTWIFSKYFRGATGDVFWKHVYSCTLIHCYLWIIPQPLDRRRYWVGGYCTFGINAFETYRNYLSQILELVDLGKRGHLEVSTPYTMHTSDGRWQLTSSSTPLSQNTRWVFITYTIHTSDGWWHWLRASSSSFTPLNQNTYKTTGHKKYISYICLLSSTIWLTINFQHFGH